jgi:hypothetical protein
MSCFSFYLLSFFFYKIGGQNRSCGGEWGVGTSGRGEVVVKRGRRMKGFK